MMKFRITRIALLAVAVGGCNLIQRTPPEPVNTTELPTATDDAARLATSPNLNL